MINLVTRRRLSEHFLSLLILLVVLLYTRSFQRHSLSIAQMYNLWSNHNGKMNAVKNFEYSKITVKVGIAKQFRI